MNEQQPIGREVRAGQDFLQAFVVPGQTPEPRRPGVRPFHHPPLGQQHEAASHSFYFDDFQLEPVLRARFRSRLSGIALIHKGLLYRASGGYLGFFRRARGLARRPDPRPTPAGFPGYPSPDGLCSPAFSWRHRNRRGSHSPARSATSGCRRSLPSAPFPAPPACGRVCGSSPTGLQSNIRDIARILGRGCSGCILPPYSIIQKVANIL